MGASGMAMDGEKPIEEPQDGAGTPRMISQGESYPLGEKCHRTHERRLYGVI